MLNRISFLSVLVLALSAALTSNASAQTKKLAVGDPAPGLDIESWVSGTETTIQSGTAYVIMFFDPNSEPARRGLGVINKYYKDFLDANVTVIAISWEEPDVVKRYVRKAREPMDITIAADRREGTKRAWLDAAGVNEIPTAFIVDRKGKLAWVGNPASEDDVLRFVYVFVKVIDGRFDPILERQAEPGIQGAASARKVKNWRMANKQYDEVIALDDTVFASVALDKFEMLLVDMDDQKAAYEYAKVLVSEKFADDVGALQMLADKISADPKIDASKRNLDVALDAAEAARRMSNDSPSTLATLAKVRAARGEIDQAIALQKQAYFTAVPKAKPQYKRQLEIYQKNAERQATMKPAPAG